MQAKAIVGKDILFTLRNKITVSRSKRSQRGRTKMSEKEYPYLASDEYVGAEKEGEPKTPIIPFSHYYFKMPVFVPESKTFLVGVRKTKFKDLLKEFVEYDTAYYEEGEGLKHYPLPEDDVLVLFLFTINPLAAAESELGKSWNTIRKWTSSKQKYYERFLDKEVEIKIEEKVK